MTKSAEGVNRDALEEINLLATSIYKTIHHTGMRETDEFHISNCAEAIKGKVNEIVSALQSAAQPAQDDGEALDAFEYLTKDMLSYNDLTDAALRTVRRALTQTHDINALMEANQGLLAENDRLRDALKEISLSNIRIKNGIAITSDVLARAALAAEVKP